MRSRTHLSEKQRRYLSKVFALLRRGPLLKAASYVLRNTCGKPNCKCATGQKHETPYVARTVDGKRRARAVPKELRDQVPQWIERYQEIESLLEKLSEESWRRLEKDSRKTKSR